MISGEWMEYPLAEAYEAGLITTRTRNALGQAGLTTIGAVLSQPPEALKEIRGAGPGVLADVERLRKLAAAAILPVTGNRPGAVNNLSDLRSQGLVAGIDWAVLAERQGGATLDEIGKARGMTREGVRLIEERSKRPLRRLLAGAAFAAEWQEMALRPVVAEVDLLGPWLDKGAPQAPQTELGRVALELAGLNTVEANGSPLPGWRTGDQQEFGRRFDELCVSLPALLDDLPGLAAAVGLPPDLPWSAAFPKGGRRFRIHDSIPGVVSSKAVDRDAAWLVLIDAGIPVPIADLARRLGVARQANLDGALRRDARFVKLRATGEWALTSLDTGEARYDKTLDAVVAVLTAEGPMKMPRLTKRVQELHAVTAAAVNQCLSHALIGRWPDGRVDLVSRGAPSVGESEPKRPSEVEILDSGRVLQLRLKVTPDVLRGSGTVVNRYVTWYMGLRTAPSARRFKAGRHGAVEVKRNLQAASISSLRAAARTLGAAGGDELRIRFDLGSETASIDLASDA